MRSAGVVRITAADVGRRVTVRARIPHAAGQPSMTDTVGVLESWEGGVLAVRRRGGELVRIAETAMVAARAIPTPPPDRPADLE